MIEEVNMMLTVPVRMFNFTIPDTPDYPIAQLHADIERTIREVGDKRNRTTNVKALMTDWLMTDHKCFKHISDHVEKYIQDWHREKTDLNLTTHMTTCWGSIYNKGDYSEPHAHVPALYSWVYYVKVSENSAPLRFLSDPSFTFKPQSGDGIIFPGWLAHDVPVHDVDEDRIIVVGNVEGTGAVNYPQRPDWYLKVQG